MTKGSVPNTSHLNAPTRTIVRTNSGWRFTFIHIHFAEFLDICVKKVIEILSRYLMLCKVKYDECVQSHTDCPTWCICVRDVLDLGHPAVPWQPSLTQYLVSERVSLQHVSFGPPPNPKSMKMTHPFIACSSLTPSAFWQTATRLRNQTWLAEHNSAPCYYQPQPPSPPSK